MKRREKRKVYPTSVRLDEEMLTFLRVEAEKEGRLNYKYGTGDVSFVINKVLGQYKAFVEKSRNKRVKVPS